MSWVAVAVGGSAVMGGVSASRQRDQQKAQALASAEANRYSSYTGKSFDPVAITADPMAGAMQGAVGGLGMAQSLGKAGIGGATDGVQNTANVAADNTPFSAGEVEMAFDPELNMGARNINMNMPRRGSVYSSLG